MKKIRRAARMLDEMNIEIAKIKAISYILWDSMANGVAMVDDDHAMVAFDLSKKAETFADAHVEIVELLFEGLREVDV